RVRRDRAEVGLSVLQSLVEPFEAEVSLAAQRSEQPDAVGGRSAVAVDRLREQLVGLLLFAQCEVRSGERVQAELRIALLLRISHGGAGIAFRRQQPGDVPVLAGKIRTE